MYIRTSRVDRTSFHLRAKWRKRERHLAPEFKTGFSSQFSPTAAMMMQPPLEDPTGFYSNPAAGYAAWPPTAGRMSDQLPGSRTFAWSWKPSSVSPMLSASQATPIGRIGPNPGGPSSSGFGLFTSHVNCSCPIPTPTYTQVIGGVDPSLTLARSVKPFSQNYPVTNGNNGAAGFVNCQYTTASTSLPL